MIVLALDLATKVGECAGDGESGLPRLAHHDLPRTGRDVGHFLCAWRDLLIIRIGRVKPDYVSFESPVLMRSATIEVTRKLHALPGVTEMVCRDLGIACGQVTPAEAKKTLTGHGNAKKPAMVAACRAYGLEPHSYVKDGVEQSDEADAMAVWLVTILRLKPQLSRRWSPLFFKGASQ